MGARPLLDGFDIGMSLKLLPTSEFARFCTKVDRYAKIYLSVAPDPLGPKISMSKNFHLKKKIVPLSFWS